MRRYHEFAVAVILIGLLALLLMRSLQGARSDMEESLVQAEAATLRLGLIEVVAHHETFGGELPKSGNPVDWVSTPPANYVGAFDGVPDRLSVWYFDRQGKELVYLFRDGHRARFRLSQDGNIDNAKAVIAGVGLMRLADQ